LKKFKILNFGCLPLLSIVTTNKVEKNIHLFKYLFHYGIKTNKFDTALT
jgi:hypothetical protein